ncbi:MAG TPA: hypothetical protein VNF50_09870 [Acidimicrobiales bacterium]|nr:hypothetical protein [Acidimicrobiales bacterium]
MRQQLVNLERLGAAMRELNARLVVEGMTDQEARQLPVQLDGATLARMNISTWRTDAGRLDVLTAIPAADGRRVGYDELVQRANLISGGNYAIRAAALSDIIASKESANRPKDHEALPELYEMRAALE